MTKDEIWLSRGAHIDPREGRCAMEWVSYLAGERHSSFPSCVSPIVRALVIAINDGVDDKTRQRLRPYLSRTIGTANDGLDEQRSAALSRLAEKYVIISIDLGVYMCSKRVVEDDLFALLDEFLPGEVVQIPEATEQRVVSVP